MLLFLLGCDLTQIGAYTCDEYCDQVISKTEECAAVYAADACEAEGVPADQCDSDAWEEVQAYAGQEREDWASANRNEMVGSCQEDLEASGKSDTTCQAETGTLNNLSCDQILDLLGELAQ
jgi:hypothetical protein